MIRLLKLSNNKEDERKLSSEDVLSTYLGYYLTHGKVAFSTNISVSEKPDYVLLVLGNEEEICYLCNVEDHAYMDDTKAKSFLNYTPDMYKNQKEKTWFIFDSMKKVPVDFLDELVLSPHFSIIDFIKQRANNKVIGR